jgi:hypothetical protein
MSASALSALAVLCWFGSWRAAAEETIDSRASACAVAALENYNRQNLALLASPAALPIKSPQVIVAQRRLQEQYCGRFAICTVGDPNNSSLEVPFRLAFSHCISDESKEANY